MPNFVETLQMYNQSFTEKKKIDKPVKLQELLADTKDMDRDRKLVIQEMRKRITVEEVFTAAKNRETINVPVNEVMTSTDARILVSKVMTGEIQEAAEPEDDITQFFPVTQVEDGVSITFPMAGPMNVVNYIAEAAPYPESTIDATTFASTNTYETKKYGAQLGFTMEMVKKNRWDMIGRTLRQLGVDMKRFRIRTCYREMFRNSHPVFDNDASDERFHTSGIGPDGNPNLSLHYRDLVHMALVAFMNGSVITDIIINGWAFPVFVDNELMKSFGTSNNDPWQFSKPIVYKNLNTNIDGVIQRNLIGIPNIMVSRLAPIDIENGKYDIFMIDRNNVGTLLQTEDINVPVEEWEDYARDITRMKGRAIEIPAIYEHGRSILRASNIALQSTYNQPPVIRII